MNEAELTAANAAACAAQLDARVKYGQVVRGYHGADRETQNAVGCLNQHIVEAHVLANLTDADPSGDAATAVFESLRLPYCLRVKP